MDSHKTLSTNHNLFEEKWEPKRYRTEVLCLPAYNALPLGQTGSQQWRMVRKPIICRTLLPLLGTQVCTSVHRASNWPRDWCVIFHSYSGRNVTGEECSERCDPLLSSLAFPTCSQCSFSASASIFTPGFRIRSALRTLPLLQVMVTFSFTSSSCTSQHEKLQYWILRSHSAAARGAASHTELLRICTAVCTVVGKRLHTKASHQTLGEPEGFSWGTGRFTTKYWIIYSSFFDSSCYPHPSPYLLD